MADLVNLPARGAGGAVHVVVECPRGSTLKLKYEPALGCISVSRPLPLGLAYPFDWGFVPGTRAEDGDPLDALVYWDVAAYPGVVVPCRAIGVVKLEQDKRNGGNPRRVRNDRIIAVPVQHDRGSAVRGPDDLPARVRDEIQQFFLSVIFFEPKHPKLLGWAGAEEADAMIDAARDAVVSTGRSAPRAAPSPRDAGPSSRRA